MALNSKTLLTCTLQFNVDVIHAIRISGNACVKTVDPGLVVFAHSNLQRIYALFTITVVLILLHGHCPRDRPMKKWIDNIRKDFTARKVPESTSLLKELLALGIVFLLILTLEH